MKHSAFLELTVEHQLRIWKKIGVRVAVRKTSIFYHVLYQVAGFYIDAKFFRGSDEVLSIHSFSSLGPLAPFLKEIDISDILE